jgi:hypothetical protein
MLLSFALLAGSEPCAAAPEAPSAQGGHFLLQITGCPSLSVAAVRHSLVVEIGDLVLDTDAGVTPLPDRLSIRCADNLAEVEAAGPDGTDAVDRTVRLDDFPGDAITRALALAGIELLAARSPAVRARVEARQKPASASTMVDVRSAELAERSRPLGRDLSLGLAGAWRTFLVDRGASVWGGQAGLAAQLGSIWRLAADLEIGGSRREVLLGKTSVLLASCGAWVGLGARSRNLGVSFQMGGRLGLARLAGAADEPARVTASTVVRAWGGPAARGGVTAFTGKFALTARVESGLSLQAVEGQAESATVVALRGFWLAVSLGGSIGL